MKLGKKPLHLIVLQTAIFLVSFGLLSTRRPDAVVNPQFWAEDGSIWYAEAFNNTFLQAMLHPWTGYFQTLSRLTAEIAQLVPMIWAPAVFNATAFIVQIVPVALLMSQRFARLIPSIGYRIVIAAVYIAIPNSSEIHANLTCAQWHLGLAMIMLVIGPLWNSKPALVFDCCLVSLASLSGPLVVFALPVAFIRMILKRERKFVSLLSIMTAGAVIQAVSILSTFETRSGAPNAATLERFIRITGGQIVTGSLAGENGLRTMERWNQNFEILSIMTVIGICLFVVSFIQAPVELKLFNLFSALVLGGSLASSMGFSDGSAWKSLSIPGVGGRYWFFPMLSILLTLLWLIVQKKMSFFRWMSIVLICFLPVGVALDWRYQSYRDLRYEDYIQKFEKATPFSRFEIPLNPHPFTMILVKKVTVRKIDRLETRPVRNEILLPIEN